MKDVGTQKNDTNFISIRPEIKWKINDPVIARKIYEVVV